MLQFVVKDRDAVFQAISDADDVIWDLLGHGIWLEHGAFQFRNHVALYPDDENLELWKVRLISSSCFNLTKDKLMTLQCYCSMSIEI